MLQLYAPSRREVSLLDRFATQEQEETRIAAYGNRQPVNSQVTARGVKQELVTRQSQLARLRDNFTLPAERGEEQPQTSVQQFIAAIRAALCQFGIECSFSMFVDQTNTLSFGFNTRYFGLSDEQMIALQYVGEELRREIGDCKVGFDMDYNRVRVLVWVSK
jgi:hypothetical protein